MSLRAILSEYWFAIQQELFPALKEELGPLGERYQTLIAVLEFVRVESDSCPTCMACADDRRKIARR